MTQEKNEMAKLILVPPMDETVCEICGQKHNPDEPHDNLKLQYQYWFYQRHGRWPTWKDAMAHCNDKMKADWEQALRDRDAWTE